MTTSDVFIPSFSSRLEIVQASLADVETLTPLYDAYRVFSEQSSNPEGTRQYLQQVLKNQWGQLWIARSKGNIYGFLHTMPEHCGITFKTKWYINHLYVLPEARRQRVALKLIEAVKQHAAKTGSEWLFAFVANDNIPSKSLFAKMRFARDIDYEFIYSRL